MQASPDIWIEKYRPKTLDEVSGQKEIVERLKTYAAAKSLPHLLFTGTAGIGKTTCAVALAREMFGDTWSMNFRELNASDERGIDVVRTQIKQFARTSPLGDAEFKILFLDEADALTNDAQAALRRTMENYAETCRFILSCNYSSKIIDPIQSRCAIYRFRPLTEDAVREEMDRIAKAEGIVIEEDAYSAITYVAQGDMRKAINALQGAAIVADSVTAANVYAVTSTAKPEEIEMLSALCKEGDFETSERMLHMLMYDKGIAPNELLNQLYRAVSTADDIDRRVKTDLIDAIGETDFRLSEGANADIQMDALIAKFIKIWMD
ncbi:MAG: replication factor C small subunit [Methanocorpusculum sp.]|nr:replication factor C small subunit [Methanocorpusculum sp.]HJJ66972.1 replication factor C small subunit [Methanocorpusculum sp.]HJJ69438.1 replication factor C small subunit [Methanocorpusculum sp.]HJJ71685.1 replication factor C small subunit [Methanocorpusculum sp.]HJJ74234.1 replication factor C small subunit [Methanocorpusculum sp.]